MRIAQLAPLYEPVPPVRYGGSERVSTLRKMIGDDNAYVRGAAAEELGMLEDKSLIPLFIDLLEHDDPVLRFVANQSLETMTGQKFFFFHEAAP